MYPGRHHHRSGEEEEEEGRQGEGRSFPAPGYQPYRPQPYGAGDEERNRGPPPPPHHHGGPDYGYGGESYQRYNPPVTHGPGYGSGPGRPAVQHVAHKMGPGPYPRPFPPAIHDSGFDSGSNFPSVQHVAHDQRPHPPAIRESRYDTGPGFPAVQHVAHETGPGSYQRPHPPAPHGAGYDSGPSFPAVQHVAHDVRPGPYKREEEGGRRRQETRDPHIHSFVRHVSHENRRTVRVFTKAEENYSLSIRDGKVILARADPNDEFQHWIKDEKYSTRVKDEEGFPCFALINKVTGEVIKHSIGATHPVRLIPYNPDFLDESILWTESRDTGEGFRCIRMVNNIRLNFDAFHGDKDHGGVRDGTTVVLWEWVKGKNQRWKIVPY